MFVIEDEIHAEWKGQYGSFEEALGELKRRATIPWNEPPNLAPCMSWMTCEREYVIIEYDESGVPWKELRRVPVLEVSASGLIWHSGFEPPG